MPRLSRMALVLLLAANLATTAALADPLGGVQLRRSAISASDPLDLLTQLWGFLSHIWSKNGSQADPDGFQTKNGSMIETYGLQIKNGHQVDPSGGNLQTPVPAPPNGDNGHQVDPDG